MRRHHGGDQLFLAEWLRQRGIGYHACSQTAGIAGGHDDADALVVQPRNQVVGAFARAQMNVNQRYVRKPSVDQPVGVRARRDRAGDFGRAGLQQARDRDAKVRRILDNQDVQT